MEILFNDGSRFECQRVEYYLDDNNIPVDIEIYGDKFDIERIIEYGSIGCNMKECDWTTILKYDLKVVVNEGVYQCLCGRLPEFKIIKADKAVFTNNTSISGDDWKDVL